MQIKKQLTLTRAAFFLLGVGILFVTASQANGQTTVCRDAAIPPGNIIYGETNNSYGCRAGAYYIKRPAAVDTMCRLLSPLPAGYVIYGETTTNTSSGCRAGTNAIKRPAAVDSMCRLISPLPGGYIIYGENTANTSACRAGTTSIKLPATVDFMCRDLSPVPPGYIITGAASLTGCPARNISNAVSIKRR